MFRNAVYYLIPLGFILLAVVGYFSQSNKISSTKRESLVTASVLPAVSPTATPTPTPTSTSTPIIIQKISPTATPSVKGDSTNSGLESWRYPNSNELSSSDNNLVLQSNDDPGAVTDWYKNKISQSGMNVKTFVTTNTNGNILNKLSGAGSGGSVSIEISKSSGAQTVEIKVSI